jgi:hypothetical protein
MKNLLAASAMMATLIGAALIGAALCAAAPAQSATPSLDPAQSLKIGPGTVIPVELTKTIDAKKAKTGDEVLARVAQDVKTSSGEILVAKNTKVIGNITEVQARNKEQKESEVGIAFDHAITKNGDMKLPMSIQAIVAPPSGTTGDGGGGYGSPGPATGGATATSPMGSRNGPMEGPPPPPSPSARADGGNDAQRPPITNSTQGVIGMSDLKLTENAQNASQGSVVSSEKSNVRLESGTIILLRVNQ